jgi:hypothetical protein
VLTVTIPSHNAEDEAAKQAAADKAALEAKQAKDAADAKVAADAAEAAKQAAAAASGKKEEEKLILGKFKDAAALEAAYVELEKKQSAAPAPAATPTAEQKKAEEAAAAAAATETANAALVAADRAQLLEVLNGQEADLQTLYEWAATNIPKDELLGYNALVTGPTRNIALAKTVLDSFVNRYNAAYGRDPKAFVAQASGNTSPNDGLVGYEDRAQMMADMRDPKYEVSPAFRKMVERRISLTTAF